MRQPRPAASPSADRCSANKRGTIKSCSSRSSSSSSTFLPSQPSSPCCCRLLLLGLEFPWGRVNESSRHTHFENKGEPRGAPRRRRRELGPRRREIRTKTVAVSARESGGGFVSTASLTSTTTCFFFSLAKQTAFTKMQLFGIHLVQMTDPVLSA